MHFDRVQLAVGALDRVRGDVIAGLDVAEAALGDPGDGEIRRERHRQHSAVLGFDAQTLSIELFDGAAYRHWGALRVLRRRGLRQRRRGTQAE